MAELIWSEPALHDLDAIADYIALDNPLAARWLVQRMLQHVDRSTRYLACGAGGRLACRLYFVNTRQDAWCPHRLEACASIYPPTA